MPKSIVGIVSSNKPDKTIIVTVSTSKTHPLYRKKYVASKKFMAHDEKNEAQEGDRVLITETRPLSARKRFTLSKILEKAQIRHIEPEEVPVKETAKEETPTKGETPKPAAKPKTEPQAKGDAQ